MLFLGTLMLLRIAPLVIRKLVHFDSQLQEVWASRRRLAKEADSYQWQKLFWIGIGLLSYLIVTTSRSFSEFAVTAFCLIAGGLGLVFWRKRESSEPASRSEPAAR